jgi:hypothetical protein
LVLGPAVREVILRSVLLAAARYPGPPLPRAPCCAASLLPPFPCLSSVFHLCFICGFSPASCLSLPVATLLLPASRFPSVACLPKTLDSPALMTPKYYTHDHIAPPPACIAPCCRNRRRNLHALERSPRNNFPGWLEAPKPKNQPPRRAGARTRSLTRTFQTSVREPLSLPVRRLVSSRLS